MKHLRNLVLAFLAVAVLALAGCQTDNTEYRDKEAVQSQQAQYQKAQPIPRYDWSIERELVIKLYNLRNEKVATHSVWRSNSGVVEGDCPSMGFGIPYDTSLTNPEQAYSNGRGMTSIGQAEPNGIFASTNTSATWVMCVGKAGQLEPIYVESKVTVYPYAVSVNYTTNRVTKAGEAKASIHISR